MRRRLKCPTFLKTKNSEKMPVQWRIFALFCFVLVSNPMLNGCDSTASVKWENKERTAMQQRIETTISNPALGTTYKNLTANLTEDERQLLNTLVGVILNREPAQSDKNTTLDAVFKAVASVRNQNETRSQVPGAIRTLTSIAEEVDASLQKIAEGIESAAAAERIEALNQAQKLASLAAKNESLKTNLETLFPKANRENIAKVLQLWSSFSDDNQNRENYLSVSLKLSAVSAATDFAALTQILSLSASRQLYFATLSKLDPAESNTSLFIKLVNRLPLESINDFSAVIDEYVKPNLNTQTRTSLVDAIRKSAALKEPLVGGYFKLLRDSLKKSDPVIRFNAIGASVDALEGEGFFGGVFFTNKRISNVEPLSCSIDGQGNEQMKYSFRWEKSNTTLVDWTFPSTSKTYLYNTQPFAIGDQVQCLVRVLWGLNKVYEIAGEVVTVRSAPPVFQSGEIPELQTESMNQGSVLNYTAEAATDPNGDSVLYRISTLSKQGVLRQTSSETFEYQPVATFIGQDEFRYQACDPSGQCSDEKRVVVNVLAANRSPIFLGFTGPSGTVNASTGTATINEDVTISTTPTFQLLAQDDESDLGLCSAVYDFNLSAPDQAILQKSKITVSGVFPFCQVQLVPEANKFGLVTLNIALTDFNTTSNFTYKVNVAGQPDPFVVGTKQIVGTPTEDLPFELRFDVTDVDGDLNCPTMVTYSSSNTLRVTNGQSNVASAISGGCKLTLNPVANASGSTDITVTLADGGAPFVQAVSIASINDAPTLSAISDTSTAEDTAKEILNVAIDDVDPGTTLTCNGSMSAVSSNNTTLLPTGNISFADDTTNTGKCKIRLTPAANQHGMALVTVRVSDGSLNAEQQFTLTVTPTNDAPTLQGNAALSLDSSNPGTLNTNEDTALTLDNLTLADVDSQFTCGGSLSATSSSNTSVLPTQNISFANDTINTGKCRVTLSPAANASGSSDITIRASDGTDHTDYYIRLNVTPQNDAPTLSDLPDISTSEDTPVSIGNISIADLESTLTCANSLSVVSSTNADLLPINPANISFDENPPSSGKCRMTLEPVANQHGTSTITVQLSDNETQVTKTFTLTVNSVNDAPQLQNFSTTSKSMPEDPQPADQTIMFDLVDDTNSISCGTAVTPSANNPTLLPAGSLVVTGGTLSVTNGVATTACTLTITPAANQHGSAIITLNVADGAGGTSAATVNLTVTSQNDAPTITAPATATIDEDTQIEINLTLGDNDGALSCSATHLSFTRDASFIQSIAFSGTWGDCKAIVVPVANKHGTTTLGFTITDGTLTSSAASTNLTITGVNDPPKITLGVLPTVTEDPVTNPVVPFTITDPDGSLDCSSATFSNASSQVTGVTSGHDGANCTATVALAANSNGSASFDIIVNDSANGGAGSLSDTKRVTLNVAAENDPPILEAIANQITDEDLPTSAIELTVSDVDSALVCAAALSVKSSTDSTLLPLNAVSFTEGNQLGKCLMTLTPAANKSGSSLVTVQLSDGLAQDLESFTLTVNPQPDSPTMGVIANQTTAEDKLVAIPVVLGDPDGDPLSCSTGILVLSNDQSKVSTTTGISFAGTFPNCEVRVTPVLNATGSTLLTFIVTDPTQLSASRTFQITITGENDAPTITLGTLPAVTEDPNPAPVVPFTLNDPDGALACASATFSNATAQITGVTFGQDGANCTATVTLAANSNGNASFDISINDNANGGTGALSDTEPVTLNIAAENDAPTGTVSCTGLDTGNVFRTKISDGSAWTLSGCTGATDVENDTLTYILESAETAASISEGFSCPATISSTAGDTSITGAFATSGAFGSCRYRLKACDTSNACTALSTHSVVVSNFTLTAVAPATPTISDTCLVESSSNITASANVSNLNWEASTSAPGAVASTGNIAGSTGTATFNTDLTAQLLTTPLLPSPPTKTTSTGSATANILVNQGTLAGAGFNPPVTQILSAVANSANYTITRTLEALAVRQGGTEGAATTALEMHSDGQQPNYVTTSGCRTCTASPFVSISAGNAHTCLIEATGTTKCWGSSGSGRLGDPNGNFKMPSAIVTTNIPSFTHTQIAAGKEFTCLLGSTTQGVSCWGNNDFFQLGRGGVSTSASQIPSATLVQGLTDPVAISASKNGSHACAVTAAGNVSCWGLGASGQLGNNSTTDSSSAVQVVRLVPGTPDTFPALAHVRSVAVGGSHTCAALKYHADFTAGLYCWGSNSNGQIGAALATTSSNTAIAVAAGSQGTTSNTTWFTQVVAGEKHSCALRNDGAVFCWGLNASGQLGDNTTTSTHTPVQVKGIAGAGTLSNVVSLSAGRNHTCALRSNHAVLCWGANESGQLGNDATTNNSSPVEVSTLGSANSNVVALSAGGRHTCAVTFDGEVKCWGEGLEGQLGNNKFTASGNDQADDCDPSNDVQYCSKVPVLVNWTANVTANANLRPRTCSVYTIP